jgi:hypothetical protein
MITYNDYNEYLTFTSFISELQEADEQTHFVAPATMLEDLDMDDMDDFFYVD